MGAFMGLVSAESCGTSYFQGKCTVLTVGDFEKGFVLKVFCVSWSHTGLQMSHSLIFPFKNSLLYMYSMINAFLEKIM